MTPTFTIWALYTYRQVDGVEVCDAYGYTTQAAAQAGGTAMAADPAFPGLAFMVLPLQAPVA